MLRIMLLGLGLCIVSGCSEGTSSRGDKAAAPGSAPDTGPTGSRADSQVAAQGSSTSAPPSPAAPITNAEAEVADHATLLKHIEQAKGRVVVVDVWSTSCLPCMQEFPHLVELARRWPEDVVCISMNVDYLGLPSTSASDGVPKVVEFLNSQGARGDNLLNLVSSEPDTDILTKLEIESMPAIFITDRQGKSVAKLTTDSAGADGLSYAGDVVPLVERLIVAR